MLGGQRGSKEEVMEVEDEEKLNIKSTNFNYYYKKKQSSNMKIRKTKTLT